MPFSALILPLFTLIASEINGLRICRLRLPGLEVGPERAIFPRMYRFLTLPGYGDSGPAHWQTFWEKQDPDYRRVPLGDWERPARDEWVARLDQAVSGSEGEIFLVAHSLGCLAAAHWAASTSTHAAKVKAKAKVKAAFLVAPPDPEGRTFPAAAMGFTPLPMGPLPFPSLVVASTNDPYASVEFSLRCSQAWGSRFEVVGPQGHINAESGLGAWPEGLGLLYGLVRTAFAPDAPGGPDWLGTPG
jgi:predicted alpha/beta hydrolase family esterase